MNKAPLIALLTDFGLLDPYAGILKAVISKISPGIPIVDLTHEIPSGDILRGAVYLWQVNAYFPKDTVFICVVDPGVGTSRRGVILRANNQTFIGPDNGLFTFIRTPGIQAWEITNSQYLLSEQSATFHGRDIFAPVGAYIAQGIEPKVIGEEFSQLVCLNNPNMEMTSEGYLLGETLFSDRFGNVLTSLGKFIQASPDHYRIEPWIHHRSFHAALQLFVPADFILQLASGEEIRWVRTYSDLDNGDYGFLVGSSGLIEIVANAASADEILKISTNEPIILRKSGN